VAGALQCLSLLETFIDETRQVGLVGSYGDATNPAIVDTNSGGPLDSVPLARPLAATIGCRAGGLARLGLFAIHDVRNRLDGFP
jgi:hypothetical protein